MIETAGDLINVWERERQINAKIYLLVLCAKFLLSNEDFIDASLNTGTLNIQSEFAISTCINMMKSQLIQNSLSNAEFTNLSHNKMLEVALQPNAILGIETNQSILHIITFFSIPVLFNRTVPFASPADEDIFSCVKILMQDSGVSAGMKVSYPVLDKYIRSQYEESV